MKFRRWISVSHDPWFGWLPTTFFNTNFLFFKKTHRLIVPDIRGNGQSGKLKVPIKDILKTQCAGHKRTARSTTNSYRCFPWRFLWGAVWLQLFAHLYPEKVKGLILGDSFCNIRPHNLDQQLFATSSFITYSEHYLPRNLIRFLAQKLSATGHPRCHNWID